MVRKGSKYRALLLFFSVPLFLICVNYNYQPGDFVYYKGDIISKIDIVFSNNSILGLKFEDGTSDLVESSLVSPIPLSIEWLEVFGFIYCPNSDSTSSWNGWWILGPLELGVCNVDNFFELRWPVHLYITDTVVRVEYIHQIQHVFRYINREEFNIDLWKKR